MAQLLHEQEGYAVKDTCAVLELARSSYYYQPHRPEDQELVAAVKTVAGEHLTYGTRRVRSQLRRPPYRYCVNRKRIQRLMRQEGLLRPAHRRKIRTTNSQHPYRRYPNLVKDLLMLYPDQVWVSDITYIRLHTGFVFLAIVLDVFTRTIRGWQLSTRIDQGLSLAALEMALTDHVPHIHHSDQGIQYAAQAYTDRLASFQVQISMARVGKPEENGYAERFMRTLKEEEVDLSEYLDFADAQQQLGHFIQDVYNRKRIHSSLGYLTPSEFESGWLAARLEPGIP
jgi:transposase InsO family protein